MLYLLLFLVSRILVVTTSPCWGS